MPFEKGKTPPGAKPFSPGTSGNPSGRPLGSRNRSTIARKWLEVEEEIKNPISRQTETLSQEDIVTLALLKKARNGDVAAYKALMDSAYGAPKQITEAAPSEGAELKVWSREEVEAYEGWMQQQHTQSNTD